VARALKANHSSDIIVISGRADREVLDEMLGALDFQPVLLTGQTIGRVAAVMKQLDLLICNDTGVLHVAAAVGCPTLALFGPTDPERWAPLSKCVRSLRAKGSDLGQIGEKEVIAGALELLSAKGVTRAG
jgi:heptosyltransferase-2